MTPSLRERGGELVGEVAQYEDTYRLCYIRAPDGLLIGLAEELGASARQGGVEGVTVRPSS